MWFQLTRSRGAWRVVGKEVEYLVGNFNSHAHVERDWEDFDFTLNKLNFNSHAHVERDVDDELVLHYTTISTHTLTWSVTRLAHCYKLTK